MLGKHPLRGRTRVPRGPFGWHCATCPPSGGEGPYPPGEEEGWAAWSLAQSQGEDGRLLPATSVQDPSWTSLTEQPVAKLIYKVLKVKPDEYFV